MTVPVPPPVVFTGRLLGSWWNGIAGLSTPRTFQRESTRSGTQVKKDSQKTWRQFNYCICNKLGVGYINYLQQHVADADDQRAGVRVHPFPLPTQILSFVLLEFVRSQASSH